MSNSRTSSTLASGLLILRTLAEQPEGLRLADVARLRGLSKSSAHMLVSTLVEQGFAEQLESGRYRLGLGAFEVGSAVPDGARFGGALAVPMRELADQSGESVSLAIVRGSDAVLVQRFESNHVLRAQIRVGTHMPLYRCASGKYLAAHMSPDELNAIYPDEELPGQTASTLRTKADLKAEIETILADGYASTRGEYTDGVDGIGTGVWDHRGVVVAALSIAGPSFRFKPARWLDPLQQTAARMNALLQNS